MLTAPDLHSLYGPNTIVLTIQNLIPWWYFQNHEGKYKNARLQTLDSDGVIAVYIPAERILTCVVYTVCELAGFGVFRHIEGNRFPVGELDGENTDRATRVAELLNSAGFKSFVLDDIRSEIWLKALGDSCFQSESALTRITMVEICQFPETRALAAALMGEAQTISAKLGVTFRHPLEKRIAGAEAVGTHKTSMLQNLEAGREIETEAIIGSITELARMTNTPSPAIDAIYACIKLLNRNIQHIDLVQGAESDYAHDSKD